MLDYQPVKMEQRLNNTFLREGVQGIRCVQADDYQAALRWARTGMEEGMEDALVSLLAIIPLELRVGTVEIYAQDDAEVVGFNAFVVDPGAGNTPVSSRVRAYFRWRA